MNDVNAAAPKPFGSGAVLESIVESAPVAMILSDQFGIMRLVNREVGALFGYSCEELVGRPIEMLMPQPMRNAHEGLREGFFANPVARRMGTGRELFGQRKDGTRVPVDIALTPIEGADGPLALSLIADVTQRRRLERRFVDAIEATPMAMVMIDRNGCIVLVNRETERLFGYPRGELFGKPGAMLLPERFRPKTARQGVAFLRTPATRHMVFGHDFHGLRKDGVEVPIEVGVNPVETEEGTFFVAGIVDVSERNRLKADVRNAHALLEQRVWDRIAEHKAMNRYNEALLADLRTQRARFKRLSREDPLTHIANRREFDERLQGEIERAERLGTPLAVAMLDLDHFKRVNDGFGHATGDAVLRDAAGLMRRQCRSIDVVARYGGEEFALVFPGTTAAAAAALCERIRAAFTQFDWNRIQPDLAVTTSAGIGAWQLGLDAQSLLAQADANLYEAKRRGRNCVVPSVG